MAKKKKVEEKIIGIYSESKVNKAEAFLASVNRYTTIGEMARFAEELTGTHYTVAGCGSCLQTKLLNTIRNYAATGRIILNK